MHTQQIPSKPEQLDLVPTNVLVQALMRRSRGLLLLMEPLGHLSDSARAYSQGPPDVITALGRAARRAAFQINQDDSDDLGIAE